MTQTEQGEGYTAATGGDSLASLFARVCEGNGERTAVSLGDESLSYDELNRKADRVAAALVKEGAGAGTIVAICMERSLDMIVAMLGVVKCGAAYLPIDAMYPLQRIAETLEDAAPVGVIVSRSVEARLFDLPAKCLAIDSLKRGGIAGSMLSVDALSPAYVIYTSGSTGRPKGVVVSHRNVVRLLRETEPWFHFTNSDVWTMFHSFAFDFSVWEIWGCLLSGGRSGDRAVRDQPIAGGLLRAAAERAGDGAEPDSVGVRVDERGGRAGGFGAGAAGCDLWRRGALAGISARLDCAARRRRAAACEHVRDHRDDRACDLSAYLRGGCERERESDRRADSGYAGAICWTSSCGR